MSSNVCRLSARHLLLQRARAWRGGVAGPAGHPPCRKLAARCSVATEPDAPLSTDGSRAEDGPSCRPTPTASSAADSLAPARLKQLRRDGLEIKDVIKMGRRGPAEGLANQVQQRWNTSEVARLRCHGKYATNMKLLAQQLEEATGGLVVHRAGGTVLLYRGDHWQPQQQQAAAQQPQAQ